VVDSEIFVIVLRCPIGFTLVSLLFLPGTMRSESVSHSHKNRIGTWRKL
jgi:hypothetical protein